MSRIIRFFKAIPENKNDFLSRAWVSPVRLLSAVLSGEPIEGISHTSMSAATQYLALQTAWNEIFAILQAKLWQGFSGLSYAFALLFILMYPPLQVYIPEGIHGTIVLLNLVVIILTIYSILKLIFNRVRLSWRKRTLVFSIRTGPQLDPLLIAHRPVTIPRPSLEKATMLVVIALLLNAVILATPLRPAIVGGVIHEAPLIVLPGTSWKAVERYPSDVAFSYFHYDGVGLWGVQVSYTVERIDLLGPELPFRSWVQSYLNSITANVNNGIASQFPADVTDQGRIDGYKAFWEDPEMIDQLIDVLTSGFNSVYDDKYTMRGMTASVRYISIKDYQKITGD